MVHLHVRSCYSLLKGTMQIDEIVKRAKDDGETSIVLSDYHSMHATKMFYDACKKYGLKPIIGLEVKTWIREDDFMFVNMLAKGSVGYQNLLRLSSLLCTEKQDGMGIEELKAYSEDTILITLNGGNYEKAMREERSEDVLNILSLYKDFPEMYIGMFHTEAGLWRERMGLWKKLGAALGFKVVPVSRILYGNEGDEELLQVLEAIDKQKYLSQMGAPKEKGRYFRTTKEMQEIYSKEDLAVSDEIASKCEFRLAEEENHLPKFPLQVDSDSKTYLRELCNMGLHKRLHGQVSEAYEERLNHELEIIFNMHFEDYFLIVFDYVRYAKSVGIMTGAGRGSAVGSLVAYCLGITHIDPLKYNLLFERFLNPERVSMPDIDIDFMDTRRDEMIEYVTKKYGGEYVARISAFTTLKAKAVLRDVARVMELRDYDVDMLTKKVPAKPNITLMDTYNMVPSFKQSVNAKKELRKLFDVALRLEGLPRNLTIHAAGVVIGDDKLIKSVPLVRIDDEGYATQFPAENLEDLGLLKMDFLSLRNLSVIDQIMKDIEVCEHKKVDIMHLPLDDSKTIALFANVETIGVFQFESDGMKNFLRKLKVKDFSDIIAAIALFRPGPMQNIDTYIAAREKQQIESIHPSLDDIVKETYGVLIYQEQIMQLAQRMAGFSLAKADSLRRAISKKHGDELEALKNDFTLGAKAKGYDEATITNVYDLIMKFADYGFNKSHSVAYAMIAYQLAYLKAHYPKEFFKALLDSEIGSDAKTYEYIEEAKKLGLKFLPFSINASNATYTIEADGLRPPLSMIKSVGVNASNYIIRIRNEGGRFTDYFDTVARCVSKQVNRKVMEQLIDAGCLDEFKLSRNTMLLNMDKALQYGDMVRIEDKEQIRFDFKLVSVPKLEMSVDKFEVKMERERNALGFYYSNHPLLAIKKRLGISGGIPRATYRGKCSFLAVVNSKHEHRTKNGEIMCFVNVRDEVSSIDVTIFPKVYNTVNEIARNMYVKIEGRVDERGSVLADHIEFVDISQVLK